MRKRQYKLVKQNRLPVQLFNSIPSTSPLDIIGVRGAVNLMTALSVADGLVYGQCYERKRFIDFRSLKGIVLNAGRG